MFWVFSYSFSGNIEKSFEKNQRIYWQFFLCRKKKSKYKRFLFYSEMGLSESSNNQ